MSRVPLLRIQNKAGGRGGGAWGLRAGGWRDAKEAESHLEKALLLCLQNFQLNLRYSTWYLT